MWKEKINHFYEFNYINTEYYLKNKYLFIHLILNLNQNKKNLNIEIKKNRKFCIQ